MPDPINDAENDLSKKTLFELIGMLRPAQFYALVAAIIIVVSGVFSLGMWVQKLFSEREIPIAVVSTSIDQEEKANWRLAVLKRNEFTTSDWTNVYSQCYLSARLRQEYLVNINFLKNLDLPSLKDAIEAVEISLDTLPHIGKTMPPGEEYQHLFVNFRKTCNMIVKRIDEGAAKAGVENPNHGDSSGRP